MLVIRKTIVSVEHVKDYNKLKGLFYLLKKFLDQGFSS